MKRNIILAALLFMTSSGAFARAETVQPLRDVIEEAHAKQSLLAKQAIIADLIVEFGDKRVVDAVITCTPNGGKTRIEPKSGGAMVFDGTRAWIAPGTKNLGPPPRFHLLTWSYFALVGTKLNDPGTIESEARSLKLLGRPYDTFKLTFADGTGDAPKDWYVVYADPKTHLVKSLAYIVTYGKPADEAEKDPHAIVYEDYEKVDGVPISMRWSFHNWNAKDGITGDPIGSATLSNVRFITPDADTFSKPEGATEDKLPVSK